MYQNIRYEFINDLFLPLSIQTTYALFFFMSFIQYSQSQFTLEISSSFNSQISMIIPITADTLFLVKANRSYEYLAIRKNVFITKGKLPEDFTPSSYIEPLIPLKSSILYMTDNKGNICKFDPFTKQIQLRSKVLGHISQQQNKSILTYRLLENTARYILVGKSNNEKLNISFTIYDWFENKYTNEVILNQNFYDYKVICGDNNPQSLNSTVLQFFITSHGQNLNKIHSKLIEFQCEQFSIKITTQHETPLSRKFVFLGGVFIDDFIYILGNSHGQGLHIIRYMKHGNQIEERKILFRDQESKSGITKQFIGVQQGNLIICYQQIPNRSQINRKKLLYNIPLTNQLFKENINSGMHAHLVSNKSKMGQEQQQRQYQHFDKIKMSVDGCSFHRYWLPCQNIIKKCRSEGVEVETFLCVEMIIGIPKKFIYSEMGEQLGVSERMISEMISLL